MVGERLVQQSAGCGEVPAHASRLRQGKQPAGDIVAVIGELGGLGGELLEQGQGLGVGRLRLLRPPGVAEQVAHGVVAVGQLVAELGPVGEVGDELLVDGQGLGGPASASFGRPVPTSRPPRLLWLLASPRRNSGRSGKSATSCL